MKIPARPCRRRGFLHSSTTAEWLPLRRAIGDLPVIPNQLQDSVSYLLAQPDERQRSGVCAFSVQEDGVVGEIGVRPAQIVGNNVEARKPLPRFDLVKLHDFGGKDMNEEPHQTENFCVFPGELSIAVGDDAVETQKNHLREGV